MSILTSVITILFALFIWIRISRQIFQKSEKKALIYTSIYSIISVLVIAIITLSKLYISLSNTQITIILFIIVTSIIAIPLKKSWFVGQLIQTSLSLGLSFISSGNLSHYITASWSEESLKRSYIKNKTTGPLSSIILLGIISGIVFGATETVIYTISHTISQDIVSGIQVTAQRSIIPLILHSGTIALSCIITYSIMKKYNHIVARIIGLGVGILVHLAFNIFNIYGYMSIITIIIVGCIGAISYGFFRSDTIYISKES